MAETRRGTGATAVLGGEEPAHAQAPEWLAVLRRFRRHRTAVWSAAVLAVLVACAALAEVIAPHGATEQHLDRILEPPGRDFLLETDTLGRDNLSRVLYGGRVSLLVGGAVALISGVVGTFVGLVSGYYGRWVESALMRFADTMLALPGLMVVIIAARILGDGVWEVVVVLAGITWMVPARSAPAGQDRHQAHAHCRLATRAGRRCAGMQLRAPLSDRYGGLQPTGT